MSIFLSRSRRQFTLMNLNDRFRPNSSSHFTLGILLLLLAGCGSQRPIKYYQLTYPPIAVSQEPPINVALLVSTFEGSHLYMDERIVYSTSPQELGLYESQRWVLPPVSLLRDALVRGLRTSGRFKSVLVVRGEGGGDFALSGHLYEFGEVDSSEVSARLHYVVRLRDRKTGLVVWTHTYNHDEPASAKTVPAVAAAMDKNVHRSVDEVQAGLDDYFRAHPPK